MKIKCFLILSFILVMFSSCVSKSTYNNVLDELANCERTESDLNAEIDKKNKQIRDLEDELENSKYQASANLNNNTDKGKDKLKEIENELDDVIRKINYCENQNDLNSIKSDVNSIRSDVQTFIFFNY